MGSMLDKVGQLQEAELSRLAELDSSHWLHPQADLAGTAPHLTFVRGRGATLTDATGREYVDGMASLFNVNVGYGRAELADAAAEQIRELAYTSAYAGYSNVPAIQLAARLSELAPGDLEVTYFASAGGEANDAAYKLARMYWRARGEPQRINIVSRRRDYHGLTYGATSATGLDLFRGVAEPLAPGFLLAPAPDPYRFVPTTPDEEPGPALAAQLEQVILAAGPETVAAVVIEPVQGAGGIIVPPRGYIEALRGICDRYGALLIADEVITGFGRTGRWFGMEHFGVAPDLMVFAKGVTSGYLPLAGVMMTSEISRALRALGPTLPQASTYSGHATCCAVGIRNLRIFEDEGLVARAETLGRRLVAGLAGLRRHAIVGDVRGLGLLAGVELVSDKETKASFPPESPAAPRVVRAAMERGVLLRAVAGDVVALSPPLVITESELDRVVEALDEALEQVEKAPPR